MGITGTGVASWRVRHHGTGRSSSPRGVPVALAGSLLALALSGCYFMSTQPLPRNVGIDPALLGVWQPSDAEKMGEPAESVLVITARQDVMEFHVMDKGGANGDTYIGFASRVGPETYLSVKTVIVDSKSIRVETDPLFYLVHYRLTPEKGLVMSLLDNQEIKQAIAEGMLAGEIRPDRLGDSVQVTADSETLAAYIASRSLDKLLDPEPLLEARRLSLR